MHAKQLPFYMSIHNLCRSAPEKGTSASRLLAVPFHARWVQLASRQLCVW